jgi:hypothetical protein
VLKCILDEAGALLDKHTLLVARKVARDNRSEGMPS